MPITKTGIPQSGLILIDGQPAGSGGGIPDAPNDGKLYARQSEAWAEANSSAITSVLFGDVETGLEQLDTSIGTLNTDLTALQADVGTLQTSVTGLTTTVDSFKPFVILDTSATFAAATWTTIWSRTLAEGQVGELAVRNSLVTTGAAATASVCQLRLFSVYRRIQGGAASAAVGSLGSQTHGIAGASMRLTTSGNDVLLQMQFTNAGTYHYRVPVYIHERTIP